MLVLAASYDNLSEAETDYEAVKALWHEVETPHDFDAALVARDENGEVSLRTRACRKRSRWELGARGSERR